MSKKVSVITLGCKVSFYESGAIKEELCKMGYEAVADFCYADYYIINTCAVTNEAEHKSRSYLTKVLNKNPNAKIIVCGCASEHSVAQFLKNEAVIYVCGNAGKNNISEFLHKYDNNQNNHNDIDNNYQQVLKNNEKSKDICQINNKNNIDNEVQNQKFGQYLLKNTQCQNQKMKDEFELNIIETNSQNYKTEQQNETQQKSNTQKICIQQKDNNQTNGGAVLVAQSNKNNIINYVKQNKEISKIDARSKYVDLTNLYENFSSGTISRTRAYLKIQDGCNNFCSYCLIPFVRGRSRSRDINDIVSEAKILSKDNQEIVLTGINMSDYKINGELALHKLIQALEFIPSRIRIGSLEVNVITDEFLSTLKGLKNFCPQFHLSMQSGCNKILKLMNRHYTTSEFLEKCNLIRKYFPNALITTDVIVGFPTETEQDLMETIETIKKANFYKMHIFPYSVRQGTKASRMQQISGDIKKKRVKILEELDKQLRNKILLSRLGTIETVLIEGNNEEYSFGYTEHYIKVYVKNTSLKNKSQLKNGLYKVKFIEPYLDGVIAELE